MDAKVSSSPFVSPFCLLASQTTTSPTPRYHFHSLTTLSSLSPPPPCMSAHHHYFFCFDPSLRGQITVWHICREQIQMHACVRGCVYVYVREKESERSEAEVKRKWVDAKEEGNQTGEWWEEEQDRRWELLPAISLLHLLHGVTDIYKFDWARSSKNPLSMSNPPSSLIPLHIYHPSSLIPVPSFVFLFIFLPDYRALFSNSHFPSSRTHGHISPTLTTSVAAAPKLPPPPISQLGPWRPL